MSNISVGSIGAAIDRFGRDVFELDPSVQIDHDMPFITASGFVMAGEFLDSMDLVDFLAALEDLLGVDLMEVPNLDDIATISKLARFISEQGDAHLVHAFVMRAG